MRRKNIEIIWKNETKKTILYLSALHNLFHFVLKERFEMINDIIWHDELYNYIIKGFGIRDLTRLKIYFYT